MVYADRCSCIQHAEHASFFSSGPQQPFPAVAAAAAVTPLQPYNTSPLMVSFPPPITMMYGGLPPASWHGMPVMEPSHMSPLQYTAHLHQQAVMQQQQQQQQQQAYMTFVRQQAKRLRQGMSSPLVLAGPPQCGAFPAPAPLSLQATAAAPEITDLSVQSAVAAAVLESTSSISSAQHHCVAQQETADDDRQMQRSQSTPSGTPSEGCDSHIQQTTVRESVSSVAATPYVQGQNSSTKTPVVLQTRKRQRSPSVSSADSVSQPSSGSARAKHGQRSKHSSSPPSVSDVYLSNLKCGMDSNADTSDFNGGRNDDKLVNAPGAASHRAPRGRMDTGLTHPSGSGRTTSSSFRTSPGGLKVAAAATATPTAEPIQTQISFRRTQPAASVALELSAASERLAAASVPEGIQCFSTEQLTAELLRRGPLPPSILDHTAGIVLRVPTVGLAHRCSCSPTHMCLTLRQGEAVQ
jgi:hypothetical protein